MAIPRSHREGVKGLNGAENGLRTGVKGKEKAPEGRGQKVYLDGRLGGEED